MRIKVDERLMWKLTVTEANPCMWNYEVRLGRRIVGMGSAKSVYRAMRAAKQVLLDYEEELYKMAQKEL